MATRAIQKARPVRKGAAQSGAAPGRRAGARAGVQAGVRGWSTQMTVAAICLVPSVLVLLPTCIVLGMASLPTVIALLADRSREKWLALSVGPLNLCGALYFVIELWAQGHGFATALTVLGDLYGWLSAFAGAALGWLIYLVMPILVARANATKQQIRLGQLRALQTALVEEWGRDVATADSELAEEPH